MRDGEQGQLSGAGTGTLFGTIVERLVYAFSIAMAALVLVQNIQRAAAVHSLFWLSGALLSAGLAVLCLWGIGKARWSGRTLLLLTLGAAFVLRLGYMLAIRTPPTSDFALMYQAAQQMAGLSDTPWAQPSTGYFYWWGYQIPFVAYQALVLKLIPSIWALKALNLLFMVGIDFLIFQIGRQFLSQRAAVGAAFLYAVYPGAIHMAAVLSNQHIATFFLLLGCWLLLSRRRWPWMLLAGCFLGVGNLMRPEGAVFLATMVFCALCLFFRFPKACLAGRLALSVVLVLAAYWCVQTGTGAVFKAANIAPYGIKNQAPEWKFVLGLDAASVSGSYSDKNIYILSYTDSRERKAEAWRIIAESFQECGDIPGFFLHKTEVMWAEDESFFWSTGHLDASNPKVLYFIRGMKSVEKGLFLLAWAALPGAAVLLWRRKDGGGAALFCMTAVCALFAVYLLVEVQPRYRYPAMPLLFLLSGVPLDWLYARQRRK